MNGAAELAGFFSAHAVWSVSDGEAFVPIYGMQHAKTGRSMERLALDLLEDAVSAGHQRLAENPHKAECAVLIYDGRIPWDGEKLDALIVEFREFAVPANAMVLAIPYTPLSRDHEFVVHRPAVLQLPDHLESQAPEIFEAFFAGVTQHDKGAAVWREHMRQEA